MTGAWNPWKAFGRLTHWTLELAHLPDGLLGFTDFARQTVVIDKRLTQAERRCTIAHETEHVLRGPVSAGYVAREERLVEQLAARKLIELSDLAEAMVWANDEHELADELWVDVATVRARLEALTEAETREINRRLDQLEQGL